MEIYEILDAESEESRRKKLDTLLAWNQAVREYQSRNFSLAARLFAEVVRLSKEDAAAELYRERCLLRSKEGVPDDWNGTERISEK